GPAPRPAAAAGTHLLRAEPFAPQPHHPQRQLAAAGPVAEPGPQSPSADKGQPERTQPGAQPREPVRKGPQRSAAGGRRRTFPARPAVALLAEPVAAQRPAVHPGSPRPGALTAADPDAP